MHRSRRRPLALLALFALIAAGCTAASAGTRGLPTPRPADVRASGTVSAYPIPGTLVASPDTTISLRGVGIAHVGKLQVFGSLSGEHRGHLVAHSDGNGASFVSDHAFDAGEVVSVHTDLAIRGGQRGDYAFTIGRPAAGFPTNVNPAPAPAASASTPAPAAPRSFVSEPSLHPPAVSIVTHTGSTAAGDILLTPNPTLGQATSAQSGPMIVDGTGRLVWFDPEPAASVLDLSVQQYQGRPVLSWFDGKVSSAGYGQGDFVVHDETYKEIARIGAGNGYHADLHDFVITPQNTALVLVYNPVLATAASLNRVYDRVVIDAVVQEIDIPTGSVLFEWHSLGPVELGESYQPLPASLSEPYDYMHVNSIGLDTDGNLLLSARHTSTIYKIDRTTGALFWRLGGKRTNFDMGSGTDFAWQHDARAQSRGRISVFDNAASAPGVANRDVSSGLVLNVDEKAMKATVDHRFDNPQHALSLSQGAFNRLPNGNWFAGWGSVGEYTEYGPHGGVRLDATIATGSISYRAYRVRWTGHPADPPAVAARVDGASTVVSASWNGATDVASWRVLMGADRSSLAPVGTFASTGFETTMRVPVSAPAPVVAVEALGPAGRVLGTSPVHTP